ncbi:hypothetical protein GCM10027269_34180 [Kribbella endophytica]
MQLEVLDSAARTAQPSVPPAVGEMHAWVTSGPVGEVLTLGFGGGAAGADAANRLTG